MWQPPSHPLVHRPPPFAGTTGGSPWWQRSPPESARAAVAGTLALGLRSPKMARVEAVLLVAGQAVPPRRLAQLALLADATEARTIVTKLNTVYDQWSTPFRVERVAAGFRLMTRPHYALWLGKLHLRETNHKLSPPALETVVIIAYRQPLTRAEIEEIRGVQCAEILKQLLERGLVRIAGTDDVLGRPFLFATTPLFLETFGLQDLGELPLADKLRWNRRDKTSNPDDAPDSGESAPG